MNNSRNFAYGKPGLFLAKKTIIPIAVVSILGSNPCLAQITADTTLGNQNSRVITDVNIKGNQADLIEGGIQRGSNLYHSFLEFNVNNGQRVYFANPTGVDNILSRVTGSNRSEILGTLGVNGAANLFLLNPNGIIFGPNTQLDIQGSFLATTANSFVFPDGSEFSATNPQAPPLLTMSVPVGVQFGSQPTASITSEGELVTGKDLTLNAGNLDLQGTLQAGRNLKLQAQNNLKVRDSASKAFIAAAGGNLLAQGNHQVDIYALNHPDSGFYSAGNMVLKSENTIGGDAHFWAGGNFRIEKLNGDLGNLFSPNDPVIRVTGDVSFDSYTGASLHILAGGSVNISGDVEIRGVDNTGNSLIETVTLSDGTKIKIDGSQTPTLDIRAGVDANYIGTANFTPNFPIGFNPQNPTTTNTPTNANININGNITNYGGLIFLTNQYQPNPQLSGNIITKQIDSGVRNFSESQGRRDVGDAGDIVIQSKGDITAAKIYSGVRNVSGNTGDAGNIIIKATGNIRVGAEDPNNPDVEGAINASILAAPSNPSNNNSEKYNAGNAGNIQLTSTKGNITVIGGLFTNSTASGSSAGNTGDITLQARQGKVEVTANNSGAIVTRTSASYGKTPNAGDTTGNAGNITIDAKAIRIEGKKDKKSGLDITSESTLTGQSGNIRFNSQMPLELNNLTIGTDARDGNGGDIEIKAPSLTLTNSQITTITKTSGTGNAGNINIITQGSVRLDNNSQIKTDSNGLGNAGYIIINASDQVSILNRSKISSEGNNGWIIIGNYYQPKTIIIDKSEINTNNTTGSGIAGYIIINASDQVSLINDSNISSKGNFGFILVDTGSLYLNQNSQINTNNNSGDAGYIEITTQNLLLRRQSKISTTGGAGGTRGNGGDITIKAEDGFVVAVPLENNDIIANAFGGKGGRINITANRILGFQNQEKLSSEQLNRLTKNNTSDISASSDVGDNGEVSLNTLSIDPTQGLVQLPTNLVDTSRLIAQGCGSNSNVAKGKSEFVITGRGGVPPSPDDTLKPGAILPKWVVNNTEIKGDNYVNMPETNLQQLSANNSDTLVEAVGMVRSANGEIVFTAQPTTATGLQSGLSSQGCGVVQGNVRQ